MELYRNLSEDSGVTAYEIHDEYIIIQFIGGERYLYDYRKPGKQNVEKMKILAHAGKGLSTYISQFVKTNYAKKLHS